MKQPYVEQLIQVLRQMELAYGELLTIIQDEKNRIRQAKVDGMLGISSDKERKLNEISRLDLKRDQLIKHIAAALNIKSEGLSISDLEEQVDPWHGKQLGELRRSFESILAKIRAANNESRALIHHCLELVRKAVSMVSPQSTASVMYQASGVMAQGAKGGKLVSNIA